MPNPSRPPDLLAWCDEMEAYCKQADYDALLNPDAYEEDVFVFAKRVRTDLPRAIQVIRELVEANNKLRELLHAVVPYVKGVAIQAAEAGLSQSPSQVLMGLIDSALQEARIGAP